ncbi:MAG TPA: hypothetical protein VLF89_04315 [Candidatus Saccharimonadales bacterium]|nr:hypothetical protein [Candidatus Saccharimonadales bacterium]
MIRKTVAILLFFSLFFFTFSLAAHAEDKAKSVSASLSASSSASTFIYKGQDTRVAALKNFLERYESPLAPDAQTFVNEADKNNIDWKLVAAISGVESTWAHAEPSNCYNSWGYNIYGDHTRCFSSYKDAIGVISYDIRHLYMDQWGAEDVYSIGHRYAASPSWAQRVVANMQAIQDFADKTASPTLPISL